MGIKQSLEKYYIGLWEGSTESVSIKSLISLLLVDMHSGDAKTKLVARLEVLKRCLGQSPGLWCRVVRYESGNISELAASIFKAVQEQYTEDGSSKFRNLLPV